MYKITQWSCKFQQSAKIGLFLSDFCCFRGDTIERMFFIDTGEKNMAAFHFYTLTPEEAAQLRADPARCSAFLAACVPLAAKLATSAGIYTPLTETDEHALQGFHYVMQAHDGYQYEGQLEQLCSHAGLRPS